MEMYKVFRGDNNVSVKQGILEDCRSTSMGKGKVIQYHIFNQQLCKNDKLGSMYSFEISLGKIF